MHALKKVMDKVLATACVALFAILVVTVTWQVFTRQVLNDPSSWSEELAGYVFVWLGMFGATLVFSERGHIAVDYVVRKCAANVQRVIAVLVQVLIIAFAALVMVWGGIRITALSWGQSLTALPAHMGVVYLVMPITGVIITLYALYHVTSVLRGDESLGETDDAAEAV